MPTFPCLPVAPSVEIITVVRVRYCTGEGTAAEPAHEHEVFYSADTGDLLMERCTVGNPLFDPQRGARTR